MRVLFVAKQKKNVDTFHGVIAALLKDGHAVTLALQDREADRDGRLADRFHHPQFTVAACPEDRGDAWRGTAPLVRTLRDWAHYLRPPYRSAVKLRQRAAEHLRKELGAGPELDGAGTMAFGESARLQRTLAQIEQSIPSDPLHEELLTRHSPDVVLVTPGLHFGSAQADVIKSARVLGIPVWMLLFSWDNLSTKGALHVAPDAMFVWNERQRREASELHDYPGDRVVVAGAPRFDEFFALRNVLSSHEFLAPLRLDPARPTLLYLCSSRFIAADELTFLRGWLTAIRGAAAPLGGANVIVRPHPDVELVPGQEPVPVTWPAMPQATGWVQRPFDDSAAVVLRTTHSTPQAFFECLHHARAVVALNTSAELEAGIAGRPVFTVLSRGSAADGQANTLHFEYLLQEQGGFVSFAPDLTSHVEQLSGAVAAAPDTARIRRFVNEFLRPRGDEPVGPLLAREIVTRHERLSVTEGSSRPTTGPAPPPLLPAGNEREAGEPGGGVEKVLWVGAADAPARVYATPDTRRHRRQGVLALDPVLERWLRDAVGPGDVLYDVGAGVGAYSILTAVQRGALTVAFEPGFSAFKALCDNVLLNGCTRSVIPLPVALGDRTGLQQLAYRHEAGSADHTLRPKGWRTGRDAAARHYTQPVCAERLDDVIARMRLPKPHAIRIAVRKGTAAVLAGASALLQDPLLRTLIASVADHEEAAVVTRALQRAGFTASATDASAEGHVTVHLARTLAREAWI
jgi:FkbM family methyltransferase